MVFAFCVFKLKKSFTLYFEKRMKNGRRGFIEKENLCHRARKRME